MRPTIQDLKMRPNFSKSRQNSSDRPKFKNKWISVFKFDLGGWKKYVKKTRSNYKNTGEDNFSNIDSFVG
jgi:hypothetical protein